MKEMFNKIITRIKTKRIYLYALIMLAAIGMGLMGYVRVKNPSLYRAAFTEGGGIFETVDPYEGASCFAGADAAANTAGTSGTIAGGAIGAGVGALLGTVVGGVIGAAVGAGVCFAPCLTGAGCTVTAGCLVIGAFIGAVIGEIAGFLVGGAAGGYVGGANAAMIAKKTVGNVPMRLERVDEGGNVIYGGDWSTDCEPLYSCPETVPNTLESDPTEVYYGQTDPIIVRVVRLSNPNADANNLLQDEACYAPGPKVEPEGMGGFGDVTFVGDEADYFVDAFTFDYMPPESGTDEVDLTLKLKFADKFTDEQPGSWGMGDVVHHLDLNLDLKNDPCFVPDGAELLIEHKESNFFYPDGTHDKFTVSISNGQPIEQRCLALADNNGSDESITVTDGGNGVDQIEFSFDPGSPDENGSTARSITATYETVLPNLKPSVGTTKKFGVGTIPPKEPATIVMSGPDELTLGETKDYSILMKDENGWKTHAYNDELIMSDGAVSPGFISGPFLYGPGDPNAECAVGERIYENSVIYECSEDAVWTEAEQTFSYTPSAAGIRTLTASYGSTASDLTVNVKPDTLVLEPSAPPHTFGTPVAFSFSVNGNAPFGMEALTITTSDGGAITDLAQSQDATVATFTYHPASTGGKVITAQYGDQTVQSTIEVIGVCGNNIEEEGEQCDDGNTEIETCAYGLQSCTVCDASCQEVAGESAYCGDGALQEVEGEQCDDGNTETEACAYNEVCTVCSDTCQLVSGAASLCGDGIIQSTEQCDDGNTEDGDGCSAQCVATSQAFINNCPNITVRPYLRLQAAGNTDAFQWKLDDNEYAALETNPATGNPVTDGSIVLFQGMESGDPANPVNHTARVEGTLEPSLNYDDCVLSIINYTGADKTAVNTIIFDWETSPNPDSVTFTQEELWLYDTNGNNKIDYNDQTLINNE